MSADVRIPRSGRAKVWSLVATGLFTLGLGYRILPLTNIGGRLLQQFPTEDGYLMLTIARNIAMGHGMSVSAGTVPTNGTQPLATFLYAGLFWLFDGERFASVLAVQLVQGLISVGTAVLIFRLLARLLRPRQDGPGLAALAAGLWFASPVALPQSMNCLETGLYTFCVVAVVNMFGVDRSRWSTPTVLLFGALLGVTFLARNDAVFLIAGLAFLHWYRSDGSRMVPATARFGQSVLFGLTSVVIASPWLCYNVMRFGHVVPISGQSEELGSVFGQNLPQLVTVLPEYMTMVLPVPGNLQDLPVIQGACALALVAAVPFYLRLRRAASSDGRAVFDAAAMFTVMLSLYYGCLFGAPWFLVRYLEVSAPFLAMALAVGLDFVVAGGPQTRHAGLLARLSPVTVAASLGILVLGLAFGLNLRLYLNGGSHPHFAGLEWVAEHASEEDWVASPQSGALGFFHDRTLNMDGKVSQQALIARRERRSQQFAIDQGARYFVDWKGIEDWAELPALRGRLRVLVNDERRNLAVLEVVRDPAMSPSGR